MGTNARKNRGTTLLVSCKLLVGERAWLYKLPRGCHKSDLLAFFCSKQFFFLKAFPRQIFSAAAAHVALNLSAVGYHLLHPV